MKGLKRFSFLMSVFLLLSCNPHSRTKNADSAFLNLDFKESIKETDKPERWFLGEIGYKVNRIEKPEEEGYQIKIYSDDPNEGDFGMVLNYIPVELIKGKTITFRGQVKAEDVWNGYARLWCGINQPYGPMDFAGWDKNGIEGTTDWQTFEIDTFIGEDALGFNFGGLFNGRGTAWFRDFEIYVDGEKYVDIKPKAPEPSERQIAWLKENVYPLKSCNPDEMTDDDLAILSDLTGNAKVVALGENTHGSSEIFEMKHRIIKYLAEKENFDVFSIEANMPEAYKINDYVTTGTGEPEALLKGLRFWTWQTREMMTLIEWMKEYNASGKRMQYTGLDMQYYAGAIDNLKDNLKEDKGSMKLITELQAKLDANMKRVIETNGMPIEKEKETEISELTNKLKAVIEASDKSSGTKAWLTRNVKVIEQSLDTSDSGRDKHMADNFLWIESQNPDSKFIVWGHNVHIGKSGDAMGEHLSHSLFKDYLTVGFTFFEGSYTAMGKEGLAAYEAQKAYLGTYEYFFNKIDEPVFILDLRKAKSDRKSGAKYIDEKLEFRVVGGMKQEQEFFETDITKQYDLLIFINKSTPSHLLSD